MQASVTPLLTVRNRGCCADYTPAGCAAATTCCCYNATVDVPVLLSGDFGNALPPGVNLFKGARAVGVDRTDGGVAVRCTDGRVAQGSHVLLAIGSVQRSHVKHLTWQRCFPPSAVRISPFRGLSHRVHRSTYRSS